MAATFEKLGIHFLYPENWTLDQDDAQQEQASISVHSPEGPFWSIVIHPPGENPAKLADAAVKTMRQIYSDLDAEPVVETVSGQHMVGYDLNFYCLDLTNTGHIRSFIRPEGTYVVLCQAEDRDYDAVAQVFRAITASLFR